MDYSDVQKAVLAKLLKKYESSKTYSGEQEVYQTFSINPEKVFSDYGSDFADIDKIRDFENAIEILETDSLITISRKNDRIQKITAISTDENWNKIRNILGVKEKNIQLREELDFYQSFYEDENSDEIVKAFCESQIERLKDKKKTQFAQDDASNIINLLNFILKNKNEILERELSISVLSNSKIWEEKYKSKVMKILRQSDTFLSILDGCEEEKQKDTVILEECNIFANPSYVYFKGNGKITFDNGKCLEVFSDIPFALQSTSINQISSFEIFDSNIMTIENLTSFNRMKQEDSFFIFLSGYHNSAKQYFLRKIYIQNSSKEYFHFGDIDPDGFLILENLCSKTNIDFKPYKMGISELQEYSSFGKTLEKNDITKANSLIDKGKYTDIMSYMLENNLKLEQEIVSLKW